MEPTVLIGQQVGDLLEHGSIQGTGRGLKVEVMDAHASGSSAMPQKRNPFATMKTAVGARVVTGATASLLMSPPPAAHERDHRQLEIERDTLPRVLVTLGGAQAKLLGLLGRLHVNEEALRKGAELEGPLLLTEHVLMQLAPAIGHEKAHDVLQEYVTQYQRTGVSLREYLESRPDTRETVAGIDLEAATDPRSYLGLAREVAEF